MKPLNEYTKKDFKKVISASKYSKKDSDGYIMLDSLVIIPTKETHDSGFRAINFVAVKSGKPICRWRGCSDVLHIDGIGGYGDHQFGVDNKNNTATPKGWCIDCLQTSGYLRLYANRDVILRAYKTGFSSFEVYAITKKEDRRW